jgi:hypothetical protein
VKQAGTDSRVLEQLLLTVLHRKDTTNGLYRTVRSHIPSGFYGLLVHTPQMTLKSSSETSNRAGRPHKGAYDLPHRRPRNGRSWEALRRRLRR